MAASSIERRVEALEARLQEITASDAEKGAKLARITRSHAAIAQQASAQSKEIEDKLGAINSLQQALAKAEKTIDEQSSALHRLLAIHEELVAKVDHVSHCAAATMEQQKEQQDWTGAQLRQRDAEVSKIASSLLATEQSVSSLSGTVARRGADMDGLQSSFDARMNQTDSHMGLLDGALSKVVKLLRQGGAIGEKEETEHWSRRPAPAKALPSVAKQATKGVNKVALKPASRTEEKMKSLHHLSESGKKGVKSGKRSKSFSRPATAGSQRDSSDPLLADVLNVLFPEGVPMNGFSLDSLDRISWAHGDDSNGGGSDNVTVTSTDSVRPHLERAWSVPEVNADATAPTINATDVAMDRVVL